MLSQKQKEQAIKILHQLSGYLNVSYFYCELKDFSQKPQWEDRVALRKTMVQQLKTQYQKHNKTCELKAGKLLKSKLLELALLKPGGDLKNNIAVISISHSPGLAGFVFSFDKNITIGFDIELTKRVTTPVIRRIATKKELTLMPHKALLWVAKESICKCHPKKGFLLKNAQVKSWLLKDNINNSCDSYFFTSTICGSGKKAISGKGGAFQIGQYVFSLHVIQK